MKIGIVAIPGETMTNAFSLINPTNIPETPAPIIHASNVFLSFKWTPYNAGSVMPNKAEIPPTSQFVLT